MDDFLAHQKWSSARHVYMPTVRSAMIICIIGIMISLFFGNGKIRKKVIPQPADARKN
jgi:hypothetical protein